MGPGDINLLVIYSGTAILDWFRDRVDVSHPDTFLGSVLRVGVGRYPSAQERAQLLSQWRPVVKKQFPAGTQYFVVPVTQN